MIPRGIKGMPLGDSRSATEIRDQVWEFKRMFLVVF
jgi:hypothetical protein